MFLSLHFTFYRRDFIVIFNQVFCFVFDMNGKFWISFDQLSFD